MILMDGKRDIENGRRRVKIIKINSCGECPLYIRPMFGRQGHYCAQIGFLDAIFDINTIHKFCLLEEYKEQEGEDAR